MTITRREFLHTLAVAAAAGLPLADTARASAINGFYDLHQFGNNVTLMHFTDCHAQLMPTYFREPNVNLGVGDMAGRPPHLVGEALLKRYQISANTRLAHAFTYLDYVNAARTFGKVGGFAHLATLAKKVRAQRPGALLLDGGDSWQGSATALWTKGEDMVQAARLLGVDIMTGHWEFTLGAGRVRELVDKQLKGRIEFLAQNVKTADFGDPVFTAWVMREINGIPVAIIGQAFPYTPIANPRYLVPDWTFGIQEENLQKTIDAATAKGAHAVILLSHNGMDVDLKLASRVTGIDVILGGHTHDAIPDPVPVKNRAGVTLVTNAGCNGKFLAVLDLDVRNKRVAGYQYRLLPVFSNLLEPDREMAQLIRTLRAPYEKRLAEKLAVIAPPEAQAEQQPDAGQKRRHRQAPEVPPPGLVHLPGINGQAEKNALRRQQTHAGDEEPNRDRTPAPHGGDERHEARARRGGIRQYQRGAYLFWLIRPSMAGRW